MSWRDELEMCLSGGEYSNRKGLKIISLLDDVIESCERINRNLVIWYLSPDGASKLKEAFRDFEGALEELEQLKMREQKE